MRITIEAELSKPYYPTVTIAEILSQQESGDLDALAQKYIDEYEAANDVRVMRPQTETKVVLRKTQTPIGFSVPTYYLSITTDVFTKQQTNG